MAEFDFGLVMRQRSEGMVLSPVLRTYLHNADFPGDFSVTFRKGTQDRGADGWFWPSTHPMWSPRMLYTYLTNPSALPYEDKEYMNVLALTMGSAIHGFIEMCLADCGVRPKDLNTCQMCPPEKGCTEPGFMDKTTGSRGHMDGVLDISSLASTKTPHQIVGFEFKTMSERGISRLADMDLDKWRTNHPTYYAQNQEYMRLSGLPMVIVIVMGLGWPWTIREIHVPYDAAAANLTRDKYLAVREAVKAKTPPPCCHASACPLKNVCAAEGARPDNPTSYLMPTPRREP